MLRLFAIRHRRAGKDGVDIDQRIVAGEKRYQHVEKGGARLMRQPAQHTLLDTRRRRRNFNQQSFAGGG